MEKNRPAQALTPVGLRPPSVSACAGLGTSSVNMFHLIEIYISARILTYNVILLLIIEITRRPFGLIVNKVIMILR